MNLKGCWGHSVGSLGCPGAEWQAVEGIRAGGFEEDYPGSVGQEGWSGFSACYTSRQ